MKEKFMKINYIQEIIDFIRGKKRINKYFYKIQKKLKNYEFIKNTEQNINTLILGSSHLERGYLPRENEYNLASISQDLYYTNQLYKLYNNDKIKKIIIAFSVFSPGHSIIKTKRVSMAVKFKVLTGINYQDINIAKEKNLVELEKAYKYYCNKKLILDEKYRGGYERSEDYPAGFNDNAEEISAKHLKNNKREISQMHYLEEIFEISKKNNQKVLIIIPPATKKYKDFLPDSDELFASLYHLIEKYEHVNFLNFYDTNDFTDEYFFDSDHLNYEGACKLTKLINHNINV